MAKRICIACRIVYEGQGSRCPRCQKEWQQARNATRPHYRGAYPKLAALVRATAVTCHVCGKPFTDPHDPVQADHVSLTELRAAHRSCNAGRGRSHPVFGRRMDA